MSARTSQGAPRAHAHCPPVRREFPDCSPARLFDQKPAPRIHTDPLTGQAFELRQLPCRIGDRASQRYELRRDGEAPSVVSDHVDYHECNCAAFRRDWECPHTRIVLALGLVVQAPFALTPDTTSKGVGRGRR